MAQRAGFEPAYYSLTVRIITSYDTDVLVQGAEFNRIRVDGLDPVPSVVPDPANWYSGKDSNLHAFRQWFLRPSWLPLHHPSMKMDTA